MKVLFVAPTYFDESSIIGGGERYVDALANAMGKHCALNVISFGPKHRTFRRENVQFEVFKYRLFRHFTKTNPFAWHHYAAIRKGDWDLLHVHQICTFVSDLAVLAAAGNGIPIVGTDHGGGGAWVLNNRLKIYPKYTQVIGQSDHAADLLRPNFPNRVTTIKGGVNTDQFVPTASDRERPFVLFVGRLLPHKGVHTLISAFREAALNNYHLKIVGRPMSADYFAQLQTLAKGAEVEFITDASDFTLRSYYQQASATILPSEHLGDDPNPPELMGFTSLESQASGTPVIVSDAGPMAEFILPGVTGEQFQAGNVADLASKLKTLLAWYESTPAETIASRCGQQIRPFSWDSLAHKHMKLYEQLLTPSTTAHT